jgi:Tfp pilus assembly protein PilN
LYFQASVGINIESTSVSLVYLKASLKGLCLAAHALYPLEKEDPEEKTAEIRKHVTGFLEEHRIPRDLAILRYIELPVAVKENLRGTLLYEMEKYVPLPVDGIYFDCQIIAEDKENNKLRVLLVAVKKEFIDPYVNLENPLGSGVSGVEISSTALVDYVSSQPDTASVDPLALVCLGNGHLELSLVKKRLLHYSRYVKIDRPSGGTPPYPILEELDVLRKTHGQEQGRLEVLACGPDAAGVAELLKGREDIGLRSLELAGMGIPSDVLATAYGLALRGIRKVPMDINLLPAGLRKKISKIRYYALFLLSALLILSILAWGGSTILHQRRVSEQLGGELKRLSADVAAVNKTQDKLKELEKRIDAINALRQRHLPALSVLRDLSKELPEGAWLDRFAITDKGGEIEGSADSASKLIPLLAASPLLKDVAFLSPITKGKDGKERFRIGFKMR